MGKPAPDSTTKSDKKDKYHYNYFLWWRTNPADIEKQVRNYDTMKVWQSVRGISLLLCLFSVTVTALMGGFIGLSGADIVVHGIIWGTLGYTMFRGYKWAFVAGMVLWTFEKGTLLFVGSAVNPFIQIVWWAIYMNAFMLGLRVEQARRMKRRAAPVPAQ